MAQDAHVVVIGAGITGTLVALELIDAGFSVTVLEGAYLGAGSSSRTAAGIRQQFSTPGTVKGMRYSVAWYREFDAQRAGEDALVQNGYLFLHGDEDAWASAKRRVQMQQQAGLVEVEALERDALLARFPWVSGEACLGGTHCPTDGFLRPEVVYGEAARMVADRGGTLLQKAPVTGARHAGGRLAAVTTAKGEFAGDLFVDCTNAWTRRIAPALGAEDLPVEPLKRYLWFLKREGSMDAETMGSMPLVIAPSGAYCRPENPESLLMGKKHAAPSESGFSYDDQDVIESEFSHKSGFESVPYQVWMELAEALPPLGEFGGITATTAGYYGTTPDHNPFLDYDRQVDNLIRLVGFSGHGAMFGPFTAYIARRLAEEGAALESITIDDTRISLAPFRIGRSYDHSEQMVI